MPASLTYPGVYVEEISSGVRTITGVATSVTAFIGRALRGPCDEPVTINNYGDFERIFGGLWVESSLGYAVRDFYLNGGSQAVIVRLYHPEFDETIRNKVFAAANEVATAAKTGTDGADAKKKATAKNNEIAGNEAKLPEEKTAAQLVSNILQGISDNAKQDDVAKVAKSAIAKATPFPKAKLSVGAIALEAAYPGKWGAALRITIDKEHIPQEKDDLFNLTVREDAPGGATEKFLNLTTKPSPRRINNVLKEQSKLVRWAGDYPAVQPAITVGSDAVTTALEQWQTKRKVVQNKINSGNSPSENETKEADDAKKEYEEIKKFAGDAISDGKELTISDFLERKGLYALEQLFARGSLFNLLCIPPYKDDNKDVDTNLISNAAAYCESRRAMLIVDPPSSWTDKKKAYDGFTDPDDKVGTRSRNAALFFPRLRQQNPLRDNQMEEFAPCGAVAGIFARTDTQRGVWKAPAGLDATLVGVPQLSVPLTNDENGELNPLGINCLRTFPAAGRVVWGVRTLRGNDQLADEWKYIPVRRTALFIEESLYRGTQWVVFEPNDEPLWAQIRLNVGSFMHNLFRQGAFQGKTPKEAYFVKCDKETNPQNDIDRGIVNIMVGFAPLKPAEFVVIKLQQIAGNLEV